MPNALLAPYSSTRKIAELPSFVKRGPEVVRRAAVHGAAFLEEPIEAIPFRLRLDERIRYHVLFTTFRLREWKHRRLAKWLRR